MAAPPSSSAPPADVYAVGPARLSDLVSKVLEAPPPTRFMVLDDEQTVYNLVPRQFCVGNARYVSDPEAVTQKLPPIDRKLGEFVLIDDVRNFAKGTTNYRLIKDAKDNGLLFLSLKGTQLWTRLYVPRLRGANHALIAEISQEMSSRGIRFLPLKALLDAMETVEALKNLPGSPNFDFGANDLTSEDQPVKELVNWFLESMPAQTSNLICFWQIDGSDVLSSDAPSSIRLWFYVTPLTGAPPSQVTPTNKLKPPAAAAKPVAVPTGSSLMKEALLKKRRQGDVV